VSGQDDARGLLDGSVNALVTSFTRSL
jgi:hypothetical protein